MRVLPGVLSTNALFHIYFSKISAVGGCLKSYLTNFVNIKVSRSSPEGILKPKEGISK